VSTDGKAVVDQIGRCGWWGGVRVDGRRRDRIRRSAGSGYQHNLQLRAGYGRAQRDVPPGKRAQMAAQIQAMPQAAPYFNDVLSVAGSCNNFPPG